MFRKSMGWILVVMMLFGLYVPGQVFALEPQGTPIVVDYTVAIKDGQGNGIAGVQGVYDAKYNKLRVFVPENTTGELALVRTVNQVPATGPLGIELDVVANPIVTYDSTTKQIAVGLVSESESNARHSLAIAEDGCKVEFRAYRGDLGSVQVKDLNGAPYTGTVFTTFSFHDGVRFSMDYALNGLLLMNMPTKVDGGDDNFLCVRPDVGVEKGVQTNSIMVNVNGIATKTQDGFLDFGQLSFQKPTFIGTLYKADGTSFGPTALNLEYRQPGKAIIRTGLTAFFSPANPPENPLAKTVFFAAPFGPDFQGDFYTAWRGAGDGVKFEDSVKFEVGQNGQPAPVATGDFTAYNAFWVSLNPNGGTDGTPFKEVIPGDKLLVADIKVPTKPGFVFAGWHSDKDLTTPWDFETPVTGAMTLYAKWTAEVPNTGKHIFKGTITRPTGTVGDFKVILFSEGYTDDNYDSLEVTIPAGQNSTNYSFAVPIANRTTLGFSLIATYDDARVCAYYAESKAGQLSQQASDMTLVAATECYTTANVVIPATDIVRVSLLDPLGVFSNSDFLETAYFSAYDSRDLGHSLGFINLGNDHQPGTNLGLRLFKDAANIIYKIWINSDRYTDSPYVEYAYVKQQTNSNFVLVKDANEATVFPSSQAMPSLSVTALTQNCKQISGVLKLPVGYPTNHPDVKVYVEAESQTSDLVIKKAVVIPAGSSEVAFELIFPTKGLTQIKLAIMPEAMMWGYYSESNGATNRALEFSKATAIAITNNEPLVLRPITLEVSDPIKFTVDNPEKLAGDFVMFIAYARHSGLATDPDSPLVYAGKTSMSMDEVNTPAKESILNVAAGSRDILIVAHTFVGATSTEQYIKQVGDQFVLTSEYDDSILFENAAAAQGIHLDLTAYVAPVPVVTTVELRGTTRVESPWTGANSADYIAVVKDQFGVVMVNKPVVYSLKAPVTGISINSVTGIVTIQNTAVAGVSFTVVATAQGPNGKAVLAEITVSVLKEMASDRNDLSYLMVVDLGTPTVELLKGFGNAKLNYQVDGLNPGALLEVSYVAARFSTTVLKLNGVVQQMVPTATGAALSPATETTVSHLVTVKQGVNKVTIEVTAQSGAKQIYAVDLIVPIPKNGTPVTIGTGDNKTVALPANFTTGDVVEIKIDPAVKDAKIQLGAPIENGTTKEIQVAGALSFKTATSGAVGAPVISVEMPAGIKISTPKANGWDGTIGLPSITQASGSTAVEIGLPDMELTFDKPVRIVLPGMAGKKAQWSRGGTVREITTVVTANTPEAIAAAFVGGAKEAKMDQGQDLVIWTMHFTEFKAYTPAPPVDNGGGATGGGATGGGATGGGATGGGATGGGATGGGATGGGATGGGATGGGATGGGATGGGATGGVPGGVPVTGTPPVTPVIPLTPVVGTIVANPGDVQVPLGSVTFTDLTGFEWAQEAVGYLSAKGVINTNAAKLFNPNGNLTRAEFAAMIVRYLKLTPAKANSATPKFKDIKATDWFAKDVQAAVAAGMMKGVNSSNDRFNPNGLVTRQEIAVVIGRILVKEGVKLDKNPSPDLFKAMRDNGLVAPWAQEGAKLAVQEGIITGSDRLMNNQKISLFVPHQTATRAEFAVMLYRLATR